RDVFGIEAEVVTATRYELDGISSLDAGELAERLLSSAVVQTVHTTPFLPDALPHGSAYEFRVTRVPVRGLSDAELDLLSREAHLFLSSDEMRAVREEFERLGRDPTDIELETLAQTWSEHCVHKTLKSTITYRGDLSVDPIAWEGRPGHTVLGDGSVRIDNLLRSTVAAATHELMAEDPDGIGAWCLSVFVDNAGIVAFDDEHAVCVKVETHNHPSAIEPYGGAATGIGGCIRDIIGTGLAAKPIANMDVFCVATPDLPEVPVGCLPPRRVLQEVVAGVRDYGNRMGIPTLNGAVWFDDRYVGNPLVYCGCVGVMPRGQGDALVAGDAEPGDRIIALGGRTGRDGIHGATFSSAELTETHADEFAHAVQIGNAIEEKRVLDAVLRARDADGGPLFTAITDCGAGGFSSAVGEMGEKLGAEVDLERAPLKYSGLSYTEIWISEAQERMVLAVPEANIGALRSICAEEHVELADLGRFGTPERELVLRYHGEEVGRLAMSFVHDGLPMPTREAAWSQAAVRRDAAVDAGPAGGSVVDRLLTELAHPNTASKHWIIRQYDHEVQGNTLVRPLGGPGQRGPMDASVVQPVPGTARGLAIGCGLAMREGDPEAGGDPYRMAIAAIDECVRNLVCVGADPSRIAILDNFCWPSCRKPENLASLVRAAEGCYDGAKAYRTPFVSGKDSLNNQFTIPSENGEPGRTIEIPPTLLISGIGVVPDVSRCVTMDAKAAGNHLVLLTGEGEILTHGPRTASGVASLVREGLVRSLHDVSDGGVLCAIAEMLIAGSSPDV
ncbi:MAG: AIR synthase-related protein, partial [Planctomycetota bacterium]